MNRNSIKYNVSYELYKELAGEICSPIDDSSMTIDLRFELYTSKLTYLYNLQDQCFRAINKSKDDFQYTVQDLAKIQKAIEVTQEFIRQTIFESLELSLKNLPTEWKI